MRPLKECLTYTYKVLSAPFDVRPWKKDLTRAYKDKILRAPSEKNFQTNNY